VVEVENPGAKLVGGLSGLLGRSLERSLVSAQVKRVFILSESRHLVEP
jgi:hypothetical protein